MCDCLLCDRMVVLSFVTDDTVEEQLLVFW